MLLRGHHTNRKTARDGVLAIIPVIYL